MSFRLFYNTKIMIQNPSHRATLTRMCCIGVGGEPYDSPASQWVPSDSSVTHRAEIRCLQFQFMGKRGKRRKKNRKIDEFVRANRELEFTLTNHVFDRLRDRMGWTTELALQTLGNERKIKINLTEGMVYPKKDSWQILISGLGVFVIVEEEETPGGWLAVTYYRGLSRSYEID